ncbi:MAG: MiaB/RimO family radical SAM methylthiotransferase, partial [Chloroflexi bacterium]|nr:MiaB/RimO family radical SAM methylthiotransferase [Chloroflexota bacterium]
MNVYLDYLGCRLNQAEIEAMAAQFQREGHRLSPTPVEADLIVLNTCAVTHEAARDSRQRLHALHAANVNARIVPTGCWTTLAPGEAASAPGVWRIVENSRKDSLLEILGRSLSSSISLSSLSSQAAYDLEPLARFQVPSARLRTRLFVKAQDGCDNHCAFCVTRIARGPARSRPIHEIMAEINLAHATGVKEIVLTGVHLGAYGHDLGDRRGLVALVKAILCETSVERLRLSSLEPWDLSPDFFDLWPQSDGRLCRHLHLPLQSGCSVTLRRMARRTTPEKFAGLVAAARERIPEVAISTDVIVGFPGETERELDETLSFVRGMNF